MLTSTTATGFSRFGALGARGLQLQTTAFTRPATCPYSSLASSMVRGQCTASRTPKQVPSKKPSTSFQCQFRRHASATASDASRSTSGNTSTTAPILDWNTFFRLRKTRRRFQLVSSIFTTLAGGGAGALLLVNQDLDWLLGKIPMDPFFSLGIITLSFSGLGWLAGPSLGSVFFHLFKRGVKAPMATKEAEFFARIKKNRVDPTTSSVQNPVPDFYGEKISSVAGYRQWLKDQRAFNRKRTSFV